MSLFNKRSNGLMDVIRCDEASYLIWKWRPSGAKLGESQRENAIRFGSSLRVKDGEVAVFVYNQKNGIMEDFIEGPFDQPIKTANLPILSNIIGKAFNGGSPFQAEIFFINLAQIIQIKFGVPYFDVYDPRFLDFGVPVAVRGTISFKISDYKQFISLHRLNNFSLDDFQKQIKDAVIRYTKDVVANAPTTHQIPLVQIETKSAEINDTVENSIKERLGKDFGVDVTGVDISAIELDKTSDGYLQLMAVTRDVASATVQANTEDYVEKLRIKREEDQFAQHMQTQTSNLDAFQIEKQAEIGIAGAAALGKMGENNTGAVSLGGGTGFNPVSMAAGMALGSAVGNSIANSINGAVTGGPKKSQTEVPPPIPEKKYYIAVEGKATGPFDVNEIKQMVLSKSLLKSSMMWKAGMPDWMPAESFDELSAIFCDVMPPIPQSEG